MRYSPRLRSRGARRLQEVSFVVTPDEMDEIKLLQQHFSGDGFPSRARILRHALAVLKQAVADQGTTTVAPRPRKDSPTSAGLSITLSNLLVDRLAQQKQAQVADAA
jgi:hypothetical protein